MAERTSRTSGSSSTINILPFCIPRNQPFLQDVRLVRLEHVHGSELLDPFQPASGHAGIVARRNALQKLQVAIGVPQVLLQLPVVRNELGAPERALRKDGDLL